jgi:RNA polymerase-binding transcription factor DksA
MKTKEELEKEKLDLENQIKKYDKAPDFGDDTESDFEEEADEAEEYSKSMGVKQALKERLAEIETELLKINKKIL